MKKLFYLISVVLVLSLAGNASAFLLTNYNFDEGAGTLVADSSGTTRAEGPMDGTVLQASPVWALSMPGHGTAIDTTTGGVEMPSGFWRDFGSDDVTVALWSYGADTIPSYKSNIGRLFFAQSYSWRILMTAEIPASTTAGIPEGNYRHKWEASGEYPSDLLMAYDGTPTVAGDGVVCEYKNQWNHWVFTKDSSAGLMSMYHNGTLWASGSGYTKGMYDTSLKGWIGASNNGNSPFEGLIDDFQIYTNDVDAIGARSIYLYGIPEPATVLLLGLGGLFLRRRK